MAKDMVGTVAVVGGSYVGLRLAKQLAAKLPSTHRVVLVENNTHFHHLFTFPRFAVLLRGGEEKAFVPYTHLLQPPHSVLHAKATRIDSARKVVHTENGDAVRYDALALATGTRLQSPWNVTVHGKVKGVASLQDVQDQVQKAQRVIIVGAGAVGVQVAFDIRHLYPDKEVVVVHSRPQIMNKFHHDLHDLVTNRFKNENIETVLGSRVQIPSDGYPQFKPGQMIKIALKDGSTVEGDLVLLCTGQTPRSDLVHPLPNSTTPSNFIRVRPTLQLPDHDSIFALGDVAETGAPKTVRAAFGQVETVSHNILTYLGLPVDKDNNNNNNEDIPEMKEFIPGPAGIHLTLGLKESVKFGNPTNPTDPPRCIVEQDGSLDMNAGRMWTNLNVPEGTDWHL